MSREELREAAARAMCDADFPRSDYWEGKTPKDKWRMEKPHWLEAADAALSIVIPACQEAIRDRAPATQDMRSTDICNALEDAAIGLSKFLPEARTDAR